MIPSTTEVWEVFSEQLRQYIRKRVDDPEDAEDLLQEVFIKIHTGLDGLRDEELLAPWLYGIARNAVIDYYRTRRRAESLPEELAVDPEPLEAEPAARIAAGLRGMIGVLPEKYRQALLLAEIEGVKQVELARRLGLSVSGAKSRVQRGREMLRRSLLDCCHFEFDRRGGVIDYAPRPDCCVNCRN